MPTAIIKTFPGQDGSKPYGRVLSLVDIFDLPALAMQLGDGSYLVVDADGRHISPDVIAADLRVGMEIPHKKLCHNRWSDYKIVIFDNGIIGNVIV